MRNVATPIIVSDRTSTFLRPTRSPKWPSTIPPTGRAPNPIANVENASSVPATGSTDGKNSGAMTSAAAMP